MSSLNPLAGATTGADAVALEVAVLKADAEALRTLLSSGDIVAAKVLPFNGLTDLIEILGKRVAASLPPTVRPGEILTLEVTGFDGDRIIVRNLGVDPNVLQTAARNTLAAQADASAPAIVTPGPLPEAAVALPDAEFPAISSEPATSEAEPEALPSDPQPTRSGPAPGSPPGLAYPRVTISVPPRAIETDQSIEARLIAARAPLKPTNAPLPNQVRAPNQSASGPGAAPNPGAAAARAVPAPPAGSGPPLSVPRTPAWIETSRPAAAAPPAPEAEPVETNAHAPAATVTPQRTAETYREPVMLLRSLHIPVTPTNVAAAKLALETPQRLPVALAALERALPLGNADPRVNTMRTIAAFVANLDPQSENFATQLSAYISHVVEGPEPKLAQLLRAFAQADAEEPEPNATPTAQSTSAPGSQVKTPAPMEQPAPSSPAQNVQQNVTVIAQHDPVVAGTIAERSAAIDYDLKTLLQSFIAQPPPNANQVAVAAAQNTLAAMTAGQLNNAVAQVDPRTMTISIPLPFMGNGDPARIKISRDKPQKREPLDADNFHIAFILDTKNVGTVAIDLQTVGRAVNVAVKSETPRYAVAFKSKLEQLGDRLEHMRYNVVSLESEVVTRAGATVTTSAAPAASDPDDEPASGLDLRA